MTEQRAWKGKYPVPESLVRTVPQQQPGQFPPVLVDVVEKEDAALPLIRVGDAFVVRTDLLPEPGRMVSCIVGGKRGRRFYAMRDGTPVLRDPNEKQKDAPLMECAIEGVIDGRLRTDPSDAEFTSILHRDLGLLPSDL